MGRGYYAEKDRPNRRLFCQNVAAPVLQTGIRVQLVARDTNMALGFPALRRALAPRRRWTLGDIAVVALGAAFLALVVKTAWMCDDAFISLRTVDNFVHGYGLRWNIDERVQAFTHPLWVFVIAGIYAFTNEPYFTVLTASMAMSLAAVWVYAKGTTVDAATAAVGLLLLTLSKSFVDYSTSGLENPLTHLLLAVFFAVAASGSPDSSRRLAVLSIVTGLLSVDRLDTVVLVVPTLLVRIAQVGLKRSVRAIAIGVAPFAAWELFSLVYYGLPFPNTAYAKLGGDVLRSERVLQGVIYVLDAFAMDPLTPSVIALAMVVPFIVRDRVAWAAAAGILLSVVYVVAVGGDFMSGRLLSAPFFVAVITLTRYRWTLDRPQGALLVLIAVLLGIGATDSDIFTGSGFHHDQADRDGIVDERRVYFAYTGLPNVISAGTPLTHPWAAHARRVLEQHQRVVTYGANGFFGFIVGRRVHVVDKFALADAFLARLPAEPGWYAGHLARRLPTGYQETIASGRNQLAEPGIAALYDRISLITREPIFSAHRFHAIWRLNTDGYRSWLEGTSYDVAMVRTADLPARHGGAAQPDREPIRVHERGVLVCLDGPQRGGALEVMIDGDDDFYVSYLLGTQQVGTVTVHRAWERNDEPLTRTLSAPFQEVFDRVLIRPRRTWGTMTLWGVSQVQ